MSNSNTVIVSFSLLDTIRYWVAQQPPYVHLLLAYALGCLALYWVTRGKGYLVSLVASLCYLVPMFIH